MRNKIISLVLGLLLSSNSFASCEVHGWFNQLCSKTEDADPCNFNTIIWKAEFMCYRKYGVCEEKDNICAWQQNAELTGCIEAYQQRLVQMDTFWD